MDNAYNLHPSNSSIGLICVPCPNCAAEDFYSVYSGRDYLYKQPGLFYVVRCSSCGFLYQNPCPSPEKISQYYPSDYLPHIDNNVSVQDQRNGNDILWVRRCFSKLFGFVYNQLLGSWQVGCNLIPKYIEGGKLIEIGCANGRRLISLREQGWAELLGFELIEQAADQARGHGFSVITGPIEDNLASIPDASIDVVIASMVLEHLQNPFKIVHSIAEKLKPGGQFLFSTIVVDSLDAKIYGKYFAGFDFPRHLVHFDKTNIYSMLTPYFDSIECFHQNAPIDYVRSSTWRVENNVGSVLDRVIIRIADSRLLSLIGLLLAQIGLTCRVSFRCVKKNDLWSQNT